MRRRWIVSLVCWTLTGSPAAFGQYAAPSDMLVANAPKAQTWLHEGAHIVLLQGPVSIDLDKNHLSADSAVLWITTLDRSVADLQRVEISLIGNARVEQPNGIVRSGPKLFVDAKVRGSIRLATPSRIGGDESDSELYKTADALRPRIFRGAEGTGRWLIEQTDIPEAPTTQPTDRFRPLQPVSISANQFSTVTTPEGKVAAILSGKITLFQRSQQGDFIELLADRAVVFTPFENLGNIGPTDQLKTIEQAVTGAYLEGDVRIIRTPANMAKEGEQRLEANRAYYDFTTDRAVLTDAVMHSADPKSNIPMVVRARMLRQISLNEYTAEKATLTTSTFNTPSYSIGASTIYIRQTEFGNEVTGVRTNFVARDVAFELWGLPVFYTPVVAGSMTQNNALQHIEAVTSGTFGIGERSTWDLFASMGQIPPKGTEISYHLDYFSKRGPATGLDAKYVGGWIDNNTLDPTSYSGDFRSYVVYDHGVDKLGKQRVDVEPDDELRGHFYWRHNQFIDDWQIQVTGGYISDPTFMEEWFNRTFRDSGPQDTAFYAKYQKDTEAFTFLMSGQPNDFTTSAGGYQEMAEVERLPELAYYRIGDSLGNDSLTFFSANSLAALQFKNNTKSLQDLGFAKADVGYQSPGLPSFGQTGTPEDTTYRGDFRQELDMPFTLWRFKAVPYIIGRYSAWSECVEGGSTDRLYVGGGLRLTTAFWKVDDNAQSDLFDIHRVRHVLEPMINVYGATSTTEASKALIYDEPVENIHDIGAVQIALNNRWQTKRGGPGNWHSSDFFMLNLEGNFFFNQPQDKEIQPTDFRGLFFVSNPESSLPRNAFNVEYEWRISDNVAIPGLVQYNIDNNTLATASIGLSVKQDERVSYYLGLRHIGISVEQVVNGNTFVFDNQDLVVFATQYQLTSNYRLGLAASYDMAQSRTDSAVLSLARRFDRFYVEVAFRVDVFQNDNSVFFNLWPEGMPPGGGTGSMPTGLVR